MKLCCLTLMLISHSKLVQSSSECDIKSRKTISFNTSGLVKHPWDQAEDAECRDVVVMFAEESSLPMLALVSHPRSGNSWLRQLLEAASGVFTGSHEQDLSMLHYFPGELHLSDGSTLVQKTHYHYRLVDLSSPSYVEDWKKEHMQLFNSRGILLIRNPYHALVSMWHFYNSGWHTTSAEFSEFQTDKFRKFVIRDIEFWLETIEDWVKMSDELHVVFYEELVDNTDKELRKLLEFLDVDVDETRMRCINKNDLSALKRVKTEKLDVHFTKHQRNIIDKHIDEANKVVKRNTGRRLPLHLYDFYSKRGGRSS